MPDDLRWIKFWPADWQRDPALRMCPLAARGLWIEMLCVMHEADPYGHLLINGRAPNTRQMATLFGVPEKDVTRMLAELEEAGVFSRTEDGTIYSRRMVKDEARRVKARIDGRKGGNPRLRNDGDNQEEPSPDNPPDNHNDADGLSLGVNPQEAEAEIRGRDSKPPNPQARALGGMEESSNCGRKGLRANGTNPRAVAAAANARPPPEPDHPLWPAFSASMAVAEFNAMLGKLRLGAQSDDEVEIVAPSRFIADRVRGEHKLALERALGRRVTIDVEAG